MEETLIQCEYLQTIEKLSTNLREQLTDLGFSFSEINRVLKQIVQQTEIKESVEVDRVISKRRRESICIEIMVRVENLLGIIRQQKMEEQENWENLKMESLSSHSNNITQKSIILSYSDLKQGKGKLSTDDSFKDKQSDSEDSLSQSMKRLIFKTKFLRNALQKRLSDPFAQLPAFILGPSFERIWAQ